MKAPSSDGSRPSNATPARWRALPTGIWALGFGSRFMDMSSELIHSLLPVFMVAVLGASMITIGVIEGVAEASAAVVKVFSGALSDYLRKRKFLTVFWLCTGCADQTSFPAGRVSQLSIRGPPCRSHW